MAASSSVILHVGILCSCLFGQAFAAATVLTFSGTHYAFGEYIGTQFQSEIADIVANYGFYTDEVEPWISSTLRTVSSWKTYVTSNYPDIAQEINGMAAGSGISNDTIWHLNFEAEVKAMLGASPASTTGTENVVLSEGSGTIYIGDSYATFQVDNDLVFQNKGFVMEATIVDDNGNTLEDFVALMYPGYLAGSLPYRNRHNMFVTVNYVYNQYVVGAVDTIPTAVALRVAMTATSSSDAQTILTQGSGMATSAVINFHQNNEYSSLELRHNTTILTSLKTFNASGNIVYSFNRFNQFDNTGMYETYASIFRAGTLATQLYLSTPSSVSEVKTLLANAVNPVYPIYRDPGTFAYGTLYSVIYDVCNGTLYVFDSNPSTATPVSKDLIFRAI